MTFVEEDPLPSGLITTAVWDELSRAALGAREPAHVAVAYFGSGASGLLPLPADSLLVVDASITAIKAGITCPADLLVMQSRGVRVHTIPSLHAKVYAFSKVAFIGSANASYHSKEILLEAVLRTTRPAQVIAARDFVRSLCVVELYSDDLKRLQKFYRPPRTPKPIRPELATSGTLVMELTLEQGRGRETQVQPPKAVWATYFGLDSRKSPPRQLFDLVNGREAGAVPERRPIVSHDHVWTLEIGGAAPPRPAILVLKRRAKNSFIYSVYRKSDPEFGRLQKLFETIENPRQGSGRRWLIV